MGSQCAVRFHLFPIVIAPVCEVCALVFGVRRCVPVCAAVLGVCRRANSVSRCVRCMPVCEECFNFFLSLNECSAIGMKKLTIVQWNFRIK